MRDFGRKVYSNIFFVYYYISQNNNTILYFFSYCKNTSKAVIAYIVGNFLLIAATGLFSITRAARGDTNQPLHIN